MNSLKKYPRTALTKILRRTPFSMLSLLEDKVQFHLGKGWGADSTSMEAKAIAYFVNALKIKKVSALDVGGNFGNWTAELKREIPSAKIVIFEPSKEAFKHLETRFAMLNDVKFVNIALGKANKVTTLFADKSASGLASLTKRRVEHFGIDFSYEEEIRVSTLDSWVSTNENSVIPNVLKMDVEGHELDVLEGATKTLENIEIIQFEFGGSNIDTRTYFQDFWYFFQEKGFELHRLTPRGPILVVHYSENDEVFRPTNYIAVRNLKNR
jgi:FkbM family methyltransferase